MSAESGAERELGRNRMGGIVLSAGRSTRMGESKALLDLDGRTFLARAVDALRAGGCSVVVVVVAEERVAEAALTKAALADSAGDSAAGDSEVADAAEAVDVADAAEAVDVADPAEAVDVADPAEVVDVADPAEAADAAEVADPAGAGGLGMRVVWNVPSGGEQLDSLLAGLGALPDDVAGVVVLPVDHPMVRPGTVRALLDAGRSNPDSVIRPTLDGVPGHPTLFPRLLWPRLHDPSLPLGARSVVEAPDTRTVDVAVRDRGVLADIDTPADYRRHVLESREWAGGGTSGTTL